MQSFSSIRSAACLAVALLSVLAIVVVPGCGRDKNGPLELTNDQIELKERETIEQLKELGLKVSEDDGPLIGTPGIRVTIFNEHLTTTGMIRTDVMSEFRYIRNLFLVTDATRISADGLAQLRNLNNILLVSAQWTRTNDKGLASIEGIVSLRLLRLNWSLVTDEGLAHIERLPKLAMLYLTGTAVTDDAVSCIKELSRLKALQLSHTGITDVGLAGLEGFADLTHLGIDGTFVTDTSIPVIASFKSLKYLNVSDTDMTDEGMKKLRDALPECRVESEPKPKPPLPTYKYPGIRKPFATKSAGAKAVKVVNAKPASPVSVASQQGSPATDE
ncbi:MAG: hypothetical protein ACKVHE_07795 [Planctomycetales bacterium]|jgi:hypothetical protein